MPLRPDSGIVDAHVQILTNADQRVKNQLARRTPPAIVQDKVLKTIAASKKPQRVTAPNGDVSKALGQVRIARLEIHMGFGAPDDIWWTKQMVPDFKVGDTVIPAYIEVMMNPEEVVHAIAVQRADQVVPGRGGRKSHYIGTENRVVTFKCEWDARVRANKGDEFDANMKKVAYDRKFLEALTLPRKDADSIGDGAPPRLLLFWENYCSLTTNLAKITFTDKWRLADGRLVAFDASFELREVGDVRIYFETAMTDGLQRGHSQAGAPTPAGDTVTDGSTRIV